MSNIRNVRVDGSMGNIGVHLVGQGHSKNFTQTFQLLKSHFCLRFGTLVSLNEIEHRSIERLPEYNTYHDGQVNKGSNYTSSCVTLAIIVNFHSKQDQHELETSRISL